MQNRHIIKHRLITVLKFARIFFPKIQMLGHIDLYFNFYLVFVIKTIATNIVIHFSTVLNF